MMKEIKNAVVAYVPALCVAAMIVAVLAPLLVLWLAFLVSLVGGRC